MKWIPWSFVCYLLLTAWVRGLFDPQAPPVFHPSRGIVHDTAQIAAERFLERIDSILCDYNLKVDSAYHLFTH